MEVKEEERVISMLFRGDPGTLWKVVILLDNVWLALHIEVAVLIERDVVDGNERAPHSPYAISKDESASCLDVKKSCLRCSLSDLLEESDVVDVNLWKIAEPRNVTELIRRLKERRRLFNRFSSKLGIEIGSLLKFFFKLPWSDSLEAWNQHQAVARFSWAKDEC